MRLSVSRLSGILSARYHLNVDLQQIRDVQLPWWSEVKRFLVNWRKYVIPQFWGRVHETHGCNRNWDRTQAQIGCMKPETFTLHLNQAGLIIVPYCSSPSPCACLGPGSAQCEYIIKVLNVVHVYMSLEVPVLHLINDGAWLTVGAVTGSTPLSISFSAWWMWFCRSFTVGKYDRLCFSGIESALLNSSFSTYRLKNKPQNNVFFSCPRIMTSS